MITDAQIRALLDSGAINKQTYRAAMLVEAQHGTLGRRLRREARIYCASLTTNTMERPK